MEGTKAEHCDTSTEAVRKQQGLTTELVYDGSGLRPTGLEGYFLETVRSRVALSQHKGAGMRAQPNPGIKGKPVLNSKLPPPPTLFPASSVRHVPAARRFFLWRKQTSHFPQGDRETLGFWSPPQAASWLPGPHGGAHPTHPASHGPLKPNSSMRRWVHRCLLRLCSVASTGNNADVHQQEAWNS